MTPTHGVAEGMHGAIIRAVKPATWAGIDRTGLAAAVPRPTLAVLDGEAAGSCGPGCC